MKIFFLISTLIAFSACINQTSADQLGNDATPPIVDNANDVNVNNWKPRQNEADKINQTKCKEIEIQNEKFRVVPNEFKNVDFENFKYPSARLKNGEYEEADKFVGGTTYYFDEVFFVDLVNNGKKEAVALLSVVSCGGSCDGGSSIIHFYSSQKNKPKLLDWIGLGSRSGGCSLKSLKIINKKIHIEQFGRCTKNPSYEENRVYTCKFCVKDLTRSVYAIKNSGLVRESIEEIEMPETDVMNYSAEINIDE